MTRLNRILLVGATFVALSGSLAGAQTFGLSATKPPAAAGSSSVELAPKVTLEVTALRRLADKGVLQLELTVTNRSDLAMKLYDVGLASNSSLEGLALVDFAGKRRYSMGTSDGQCLCSAFSNQGLVRPGEAKTFWAWFALPQGDVRQMSVLVQDRSPILDVPLQ